MPRVNKAIVLLFNVVSLGRSRIFNWTKNSFYKILKDEKRLMFLHVDEEDLGTLMLLLLTPWELDRAQVQLLETKSGPVRLNGVAFVAL
ncbi:hypothetical protein F4819DRAFT_445091 [Hypoxylon fuscum]|nr:hypothetical protein F4819DRAFT_445091 [Hypoxylon fuscum]